MEKVLKMKWIYALQREMVSTNDKDIIWFEWVKLNLPCDVNYFLKCNLNHKYMEQVLQFPPGSIWHDIFHHWRELNYDNHPAGNDNIKKQCIWLNRLIRCNKKVMLNRKMFNP